MIATLSRHVKDEMATRIEEQRAKIRALELAVEERRRANEIRIQERARETESGYDVKRCGATLQSTSGSL